MYQFIQLEKEGGIAIISINRPDKNNAFNSTVMTEMSSAIEEIARDEKIRVVILTGSGKHFAAGADVEELKTLESPIQAHACLKKYTDVYEKLDSFEKPIIAAVKGFTLGGGCELMLCADIVIADSTAKIGLPEVKFGILPGGGGTQKLARLMGSNRAKEYLFTGEPMDAFQALNFGIVNRVVDPEKLMEEVKDLAYSISKRPPRSIQFIKQCVNQGTEIDLKAALELEKQAFTILCLTEDKKEGFSAFFERREPLFKGS
jgi:enoyl-CoA hydratase/carnithine racemase